MPIAIVCRGVRCDEGFRADIIVESKVIIELKSVERIANDHKKQLLAYLKLTGMKLGYLLNFGEGMMKRGITRTVNGLPELEISLRSWRLGERKTDSNQSMHQTAYATLRATGDGHVGRRALVDNAAMFLRKNRKRLLCCPLPERGHPLLAKGAYLLRTNCTETDPAKLWRWHIQLTQAEAALRSAKSDIGLRPVYHQKTGRVQAHLLVCFLSLALWRSLESWMSANGLGTRAAKLVAALSTIRSMDVVVPVKRAGRTIELRLRTVAKPDADVAVLLAHLGLKLLPKGSRLVQNVVEKNA